MGADETRRSKVQPLRRQLAERMREVRLELFGEHGVPELARLMGLPERTWTNVEMGASVPSEVVLAFLDITACSPRWLLTGSGPKYQSVEPLGQKPYIS
jgi:hypothetical protein